MNRVSWSYEEDQAISKLVAEFGFNDWTKIAQKLKENYAIGKRTGKQCRQRWYNHLNPSVNKKPWNNDEEERLFQLHKQHGNRWKDISRQFTGRTDNDIKNHFYSTLRRSLRRLNKILGQKNSTSQMREIKPSVLSTIMNYLYEQEHGLENQLFRSLKDLPSLIFQFANFKPIKTNLRLTRVEDAKSKISEIFELINRFNQEYERTKIQKHSIRQLKRSLSRRDSKDQPKQHIKEQHLQIGETFKTSAEMKCTETSIAVSSEQVQKDEQQEDLLMKAENSGRVKLQERQHQECAEEGPGQLHTFRSRNMSLQDDEMALEQMQELQQPSIISGQGEWLDLTVVGHHWEPQSWEREAEMKQFVDQVLEINYQQIEAKK